MNKVFICYDANGNTDIFNRLEQSLLTKGFVVVNSKQEIEKQDKPVEDRIKEADHFAIILTEQSSFIKTFTKNAMSLQLQSALKTDINIIPIYIEMTKQDIDSPWDKSYVGIEKYEPLFFASGKWDESIELLCNLTNSVEGLAENDYYTRALVELWNNQPQSAFDSFEKAIDSIKKSTTPDKRIYEKILLTRGEAYYKQSEYDKALNDFLYVITRVTQQSFDAYYRAGLTYLKQENYAKALEYFDQAQSLREGKPNISDDLRLLLGRAEAHFGMQKYHLALDEAQAVVDRADKDRDREILYQAHHLLAQIYQTDDNCRNFKLALSHLNSAVNYASEDQKFKLYSQIGAVRQIIESLPSRLTSIDITRRFTRVENSLSQLGQYINNAVKADLEYDQASAKKAFEDAKSYLMNQFFPLLNLFVSHFYTNDALFTVTQSPAMGRLRFQEAQEQLLQVPEALFPQDVNELRAVLDMNFSALSLDLDKDVKTAMSFLNTALKRLKKLPDSHERKPDWSIVIDINFSHLYTLKADMSKKSNERIELLNKARTHASKAKEEAHKLKAILRELDATMKLAEICNRLKDYYSAKRYFEEAKQIATATEHPLAVDATISLAEVRRRTGDLQGARQELTKILEVSNKKSRGRKKITLDHFSEAWARIELGNTYKDDGNHKSALEEYTKAKAIAPIQEMKEDIEHFIKECEVILGRIIKRDKVFISYSHKDKILLDELNTHLVPMIENGTVKSWNDTDIPPGGDWRKEIEESLASAKVAVLLVSPYFLASKFIRDEELPVIFDAATKGELTIIWVPLTASNVEQTEISKYQAAWSPDKPLDTLPKPRRNGALVKVCKAIQEAFNK